MRIFSPADIDALMQMASLANGNYAELYGTMISSYGNYIIRFTGTSSDIQTGLNTIKWREEFKTFFIRKIVVLKRNFYVSYQKK